MNAFQTFATNRGLITGSAAHTLAAEAWDHAIAAAIQAALDYDPTADAGETLGATKAWNRIKALPSTAVPQDDSTPSLL
jgi:hypothetical protein